MKKMFFAAVSLLFLIAGCSSSTKQVNSVTIWHWMTDRQDAFLKLAEQYEQQTNSIITRSFSKRFA